MADVAALVEPDGELDREARVRGSNQYMPERIVNMLPEEITRRLIDEFVECLEAKMAASTIEESEAIQTGEVKGITLLLSGLIGWLRKFFKRLFGGGR